MPDPIPKTAPPPLAADEHLGRLARVLRLAGADVAHRNPFPDEDLLRHAREDGRVVLTMDARLVRHLREGRFVHIESHEIGEQVRQVLRAHPFDPLERAFTRCTLCNAPLRDASPGEVEEQVPVRVREIVARYVACPACNKVYWEGSHTRRMRAWLEDVRRSLAGPA